MFVFVCQVLSLSAGFKSQPQLEGKIGGFTCARSYKRKCLKYLKCLSYIDAEMLSKRLEVWHVQGVQPLGDEMTLKLLSLYLPVPPGVFDSIHRISL